jgi:hypothetical protein
LSFGEPQLRIRVAYVGGIVRLPKRRITRWTDRLRWAASGMIFTDYGRILNRDRLRTTRNIVAKPRSIQQPVQVTPRTQRSGPSRT